ncbi:BamA/TamA family outer membrane protein [Marinigracilibium pacificum]|uniref:BamA/TamA family outer membrane protein n=1 Tax=Marinigracilibium pacificum TaxID=2729599 RepID=A0A848J459_9BACT|nr:BamA/TamA family outer membrane protein [Marinigracilibium pacificum]NMM49139.1 BamA/TamA family outer membrane protein [Marinigracilibium pacificum]
MRLYFSLVLIFTSLIIKGQTNSSVTLDESLNDSTVRIGKVFIVGNKKTKDVIILREMQLIAGETVAVSELKNLLTQDRNNIFNTSLFVTVELRIIPAASGEIDILVQLKERWYTFPTIKFELADRNFSEWWINQGKSLDRVNYGVGLYQYNLRGMDETLSLGLQFGYTREFLLGYNIPYINKGLKTGLETLIFYNDNRNIPYDTRDNMQQFLDSERKIRREFRISETLRIRESIQNTHSFRIAYQNIKIDDTVALENPDYFLNGDTEKQFLILTYQFSRDLRDVSAYPLNGFLLAGSINQSGTGLFSNSFQTSLEAEFAKYKHLGKGYYLSNRISGRASFPPKQPYFVFRGMGYKKEIIRGFELNVIDGQHFILNKSTFKKELFSNQFKLGNWMPIDQFRTVPVALYLKSFFDIGYVDNSLNYGPDNNLINQVNFGYGLGLDLVTYYDFVMRFEYSFNSEGQNRFFFNIKTAL